MKDYQHGGDVYKKENKIVADFSVNLNPLGMTEEVKIAICKNIDKYSTYPDPFCRKLISKLSEYEKLSENYFVCGNGAADLIFRLSLHLEPKKAILLAPTFSEYEESLKFFQCEISHYYLKEEKNFEIEYTILDFIEKNKDVDILFLCNPNNPVGNLIKYNLIEEILKVTEKYNIVTVIDECFLPLVKNGDSLSAKKYIGKFQNLVILRAFTKTYAMAGIRLGYLISSNISITDGVFKVGQPWSVSTVAQIAGIECCNIVDFAEKATLVIEEERNRLVLSLERKGFKVYKSEANFILFKIDEDKFFIKNKVTNIEKGLVTFLDVMAQKGILVRDCSNYLGLEKGYYRIAVRDKKDNDFFLSKLEEI